MRISERIHPIPHFGLCNKTSMGFFNPCLVSRVEERVMEREGGREGGISSNRRDGV